MTLCSVFFSVQSLVLIFKFALVVVVIQRGLPRHLSRLIGPSFLFNFVAAAEPDFAFNLLSQLCSASAGKKLEKTEDPRRGRYPSLFDSWSRWCA